MQITDFLQKELSPKASVVLTYLSGICDHFGALLRQIWPEGRVLIVSSPEYREFSERSLLPSLRAHGYDASYCLCLPTPGVSMRAHIEESLGDGVLNGLTGMASLGGSDLFDVVRECAGALNVSCCALLNEFAPRTAFAACGENKPCADAIFFDLNEILSKMRGDIRESLVSLEIEVYALRADVYAAQAAGAPVHAAVLDALDQALPPRIAPTGAPTEDDLGQLAESYAWRAAALRLMHLDRLTSYETVMAYAAAGEEFPAFTSMQHARVMARIFESVLETDSLEISPESCANRQPPKEILARTLRQILLEDGIKFDWLKRAEAAYDDRSAMRLSINTIAMNWDEYCAKMRSIADMMQAIGSQQSSEDDEIDSTLKNLWIHAARFAPRHSFIKILNDMGMIEPVLYL